MIFFKKKTQETKPVKTRRSLREIVEDRVLTAEGWRRRTVKKAPKKGK